MILAGDVGGTKTLLALRSEVNGKIVEHEFEKFVSKDFESLEEMVAGFIKDCKAKIQLRKDCFLAGVGRYFQLLKKIRIMIKSKKIY